jgi:hypothetical protein
MEIEQDKLKIDFIKRLDAITLKDGDMVVVKFSHFNQEVIKSIDADFKAMFPNVKLRFLPPELDIVGVLRSGNIEEPKKVAKPDFALIKSDVSGAIYAAIAGIGGHIEERAANDIANKWTDRIIERF